MSKSKITSKKAVAIRKAKKSDKSQEVTRLSEIDTDEVHLVFRGANGMDFAVVKSEKKAETADLIQVLELAEKLADAKDDERKSLAVKMFEPLAAVAGVEVVKDDDGAKAPHWMSQMRDLMGTISETLTVLRDTNEKNTKSSGEENPDYLKVLFKSAGIPQEAVQSLQSIEKTKKELQDRIEKMNAGMGQVAELVDVVKRLGEKMSSIAKRVRNMEMSPVQKSGLLNDEDRPAGEDEKIDWSGDLTEQLSSVGKRK
jgi:hypothetical protein